MYLHFTANQTVTLDVPSHPTPIQHYLRQPQRLVHALTDPTRVELLGEHCFRLKMRPVNFLMITLQPVVDMEVKAAADGSIRLRSKACEIRGVDYINQRFRLDLIGYLRPEVTPNQTKLIGQADLKVGVDMPPPLSLTPLPILEATGNGLLKSVLLTIKQRLMHQLLADYGAWLEEQHPHELPAEEGMVTVPGLV
ncbi:MULTISPECIES: DUF1997 domain-containing protein [Cyanophyceae]|uniref:DUF1997 domain-containing protein n=1 Tax=Pseudocalidococcus azoricus BACA0444 TaxID=2918990 RepID=A0AAE4JVE4_9CYAN|nr:MULTISPECIES: DUF1997 domain-containing protein [Cyanophyceae]AFY62456.1 Protein of unknown function (DUF1997) [Synechococcus sp. PCC 6312]MDS3859901.1 DUF1997 domain-containing protein [Pseudocalidococcus azoricus BACA0444]